MGNTVLVDGMLRVLKDGAGQLSPSGRTMKRSLLVLATLSLTTGQLSLTAEFKRVICEGTYTHHLQGVCTDEREAIFWCFTSKLVKTDSTGKVIRQIDVAKHHGDLCFHNGTVWR